MMDELQLDKAAVSTLMPFPGTALFKQVVKDKLFIRNWNLDELWKTPVAVAGADLVKIAFGEEEFIAKISLLIKIIFL